MDPLAVDGFPHQKLRVNESIPSAPPSALFPKGTEAVGKTQYPKSVDTQYLHANFRSGGAQPRGATSNGADSPVFYLFVFLAH